VSTPRITARKKLETTGSGSASSPLPFPVGGENHRHLQKKKKTQAKFRFFLPLLNLLSFGFSLSLGSLIFLLQVTNPRRRSSAAATGLLLTGGSTVQRAPVNLWTALLWLTVWTTLLCCGFVSVEADLRGDEGELQ